MKRVYKVTAWAVGGIVLLCVCVVVAFIIMNREFDKTVIYPDENRIAPADTIIDVNGVAIKMIGIKGGKIDCTGLKETIELKDFYIGETEVTQALWYAVMRNNSSIHQGDSLPVENVDLVECMEFVTKLDSISGHNFMIPSYPQWLYAGYMGQMFPADNRTLDGIAWYKNNSGNVTHGVKQKNPDSLGIYDMLGNVAEWTVSGSDPLFIAAGGSYETEKEYCNDEHREFDHGKVKSGNLGLRLISYPTGAREK